MGRGGDSVEEEGGAGGVEGNEHGWGWGSYAPQLSETVLGKVWKSPNEKWRVYIPSSIDVRPMGETEKNAYAQMDQSRSRGRLAQTSFMLMIQLTP